MAIASGQRHAGTPAAASATSVGERLRLLDHPAAPGAGELDDPTVGDGAGQRLGGRPGVGRLVLADDDDDRAP